MNRIGSAIRLMLCLPPVWIAMTVAGWVLVANGWEPFLDILFYALQRLAQ